MAASFAPAPRAPRARSCLFFPTWSRRMTEDPVRARGRAKLTIQFETSVFEFSSRPCAARAAATESMMTGPPSRPAQSVRSAPRSSSVKSFPRT